MRIPIFLLIIAVTSVFTSCDKYCGVELINLSNDTIYIETDFPDNLDPKIDSRAKNINYQRLHILSLNQTLLIDTAHNTFTAKIAPNDIFHIHNWVVKVDVRDFFFSRLTIYTSNDTIVASSKEDILELTKKQHLKYNKEKDEGKLRHYSSCSKYIIIRD